MAPARPLDKQPLGHRWHTCQGPEISCDCSCNSSTLVVKILRALPPALFRHLPRPELRRARRHTGLSDTSALTQPRFCAYASSLPGLNVSHACEWETHPTAAAAEQIFNQAKLLMSGQCEKKMLIFLINVKNSVLHRIFWGGIYNNDLYCLDDRKSVWLEINWHTHGDHNCSFTGGVGRAADTLLSVLQCKQLCSHQQRFLVLFFLLMRVFGVGGGWGVWVTILQNAQLNLQRKEVPSGGVIWMIITISKAFSGSILNALGLKLALREMTLGTALVQKKLKKKSQKKEPHELCKVHREDKSSVRVYLLLTFILWFELLLCQNVKPVSRSVTETRGFNRGHVNVQLLVNSSRCSHLHEETSAETLRWRVDVIEHFLKSRHSLVMRRDLQ